MGRTTKDEVAALREHINGSQARSGYHPYWTTSPVVPDEPLWAISFRRPTTKERVGAYRSATRDLDQAIVEAREYLCVPKSAKVSVLPAVPRSDTYRGAKSILTAMMLAVPPKHPATSEMFDQLYGAWRVVIEAEKDGRYFGGLTVDLPIAVEIDEFNLGRPRSIKMVCWSDHGGDWPEWNRCTTESAN